VDTQLEDVIQLVATMQYLVFLLVSVELQEILESLLVRVQDLNLVLITTTSLDIMLDAHLVTVEVVDIMLRLGMLLVEKTPLETETFISDVMLDVILLQHHTT
jgi:hypothetical protein